MNQIISQSKRSVAIRVQWQEHIAAQQVSGLRHSTYCKANISMQSIEAIVSSVGATDFFKKLCRLSAVCDFAVLF